MLTVQDEQQYFEFKLGENGTVQRLPLANKLPLSFLREFADMGKLIDPAQRNAAAVDLEIKLLKKYCPEIADDVTLEQANLIVTEWNKASGIQLGE